MLFEYKKVSYCKAKPPAAHLGFTSIALEMQVRRRLTLKRTGFLLGLLLSLPTLVSCSSAAQSESNVLPDLDSCPGYDAKNVRTSRNGNTLTAELVLRGSGCGVFGSDIRQLALEVVYETDTRIHLKITDPAVKRYEVPISVFPRPVIDVAHPINPRSAAIQFNFTTSPFSFSVSRTKTREVLFSTASHPIIFEPQYLRLKTRLPVNANVYGLGEHTNPFRLNPDNSTLTFWSRDAFGIPTGTNLYGNHPVYFEHRTTGTHGVLFLNSNGMDIKLTRGALEYNAIGGVMDFYFLAGSETDPTEVARQYAQLVGLPAEVPYWSFGFHQCRFGYNNFVDVADVISNYSAAQIPLETMWTDIDYMFKRRIFTVDPDYFPLSRMREVVSYLHDHDQRFVLMTDPAVAFLPDGGYGPYDRGTALDIWLKAPNGSQSLGLVWPGVTVYPDWFHDKIQEYWDNEFALFYNPEDGLDIDGAWIDMNEPASFCNSPCTDPFQQAIEQALPPPRAFPPPDPNTPIFANANASHPRNQIARRDLLKPAYTINNAAGDLSSKTAFTDAKHFNGLVEYDVHNLYGTMMSTATRNALLARRPGLRTLVITRSTFAGAGHHVGKWLGDNMSLWEHYRLSIAGMLGMASVYQVPMVGSDICGFAGNTTQNLCARWAMLGAFYPFMRNHNSDTSISQEFYRWPIVTVAAQNAIDIRYRLLDYFYTAFHQAHLDGTPVLHPLWFKYPKDPATFGLDLQFFFGDSILVSPVTQEDATSVSIYLPRDTFYDFHTLLPVQGTGSTITLNDLSFSDIPLHIKGGVVLPLRVKSAMTTTALREQDFEFIIAPRSDGRASGKLYIDDGVSITPTSSTAITMLFDGRRLRVQGSFGFGTGLRAAKARFLGVKGAVESVQLDGRVVRHGVFHNQTTQVLEVSLDMALDKGFTIVLSK